MKKSNYYMAIIDGVLQFIGIKIAILLTKELYLTVSPEYIIIFNIAIPIFTAIIYYLILLNERSNKRIILTAVCGSVVFVLLLIIDFAIILLLSSSLNSTDNYALGIILIISLFVFIAASLIFRACVLLGLIIRNKHRIKNNNKDDDSVSK